MQEKCKFLKQLFLKVRLEFLSKIPFFYSSFFWFCFLFFVCLFVCFSFFLSFFFCFCLVFYLFIFFVSFFPCNQNLLEKYCFCLSFYSSYKNKPPNPKVDFGRFLFMYMKKMLYSNTFKGYYYAAI